MLGLKFTNVSEKGHSWLFIKEQLKFNGGLAKLVLTSFVI